MSDPAVLVLYNQPVLPLGHPDAESEQEIMATVETVRHTLGAAGFDLRELGVGHDPRPLLQELYENRPDAVFNLFEGLADRAGTELAAAGILEWLDVPFTGSPAEALALARHKVRVKYLLGGAGLPTPAFFMVDEGQPVPVCPLDWPVIVKPALQDASVGIEQGSVVTNQKQLVDRIANIIDRYGGPVLVERFVHGRELFVSLIEELNGPPGRLTVLPLAEILFLEKDPAVWPIYSYDAKWREGTREYVTTPLRSPVELEPVILERVARVARQAYRLVGCRDYARIDVRLTADGQPFILEVNPNPFLNSQALINGLEALGQKHTDFIADLVRMALKRSL